MQIIFSFIFLFFSFSVVGLDNKEIAKKLYYSTFQILVSDSESNEIGWGSASLINKKGNKYYFVTNAHVILKETCSLNLWNTDCENLEYEDDISIYATHPLLKNEYSIDYYIYFEEDDLAIITIEIDQKEFEEEETEFVPLELASLMDEDSFYWELEQIFASGYPDALGNPEDYDYKQLFMTSGVINSFIYDETSLTETAWYDIAHDAIVKSGMSGGPLVNKEGKLVGINGLNENSSAKSNNNNSGNCYFSWSCYFHSHSEEKLVDIEVGRFYYAISIDSLIERSLTDTSRSLFEDEVIKGFLPKLNKKKFIGFYNWFNENYPENQRELDLIIK